jgi:hypothetical protein
LGEIEGKLETISDRLRGQVSRLLFGDDLRRLLGGRNMANEDPEVLLQSALLFFKFLPGHERQKFVHRITEKAS